LGIRDAFRGGLGAGENLVANPSFLESVFKLPYEVLIALSMVAIPPKDRVLVVTGGAA
jgi:hypothetical protein